MSVQVLVVDCRCTSMNKELLNCYFCFLLSAFAFCRWCGHPSSRKKANIEDLASFLFQQYAEENVCSSFGASPRCDGFLTHGDCQGRCGSSASNGSSFPCRTPQRKRSSFILPLYFPASACWGSFAVRPVIVCSTWLSCRLHFKLQTQSLTLIGQVYSLRSLSFCSGYVRVCFHVTVGLASHVLPMFTVVREWLRVCWCISNWNNFSCVVPLFLYCYTMAVLCWVFWFCSSRSCHQTTTLFTSTFHCVVLES